MNKIFKKTGIVGVACLMALMLTSSPSVAWCWSVEHTTGYWTEGRSVPSGEIDTYQVIHVQNGHTQEAYSIDVTGGTWQYPTDVHMGGQNNKYLIFHSSIDFYVYWGDNAPPRPEGCADIYAEASIELQKLVVFNWIPAGNFAEDHFELITHTPGTTMLTAYNHVWNDTTPLQANDLYRLMIYEVGGWIDGSGQYHPDNSPTTSYEYYRIKNP